VLANQLRNISPRDPIMLIAAVAVMTLASLAACYLQVGRKLTAADDGVLVGHRVLICDRDRKWTPSVWQLLATSGIRIVQTPFQAPNANAYAERFVRSILDQG
jgi:hypothetical protein